MTLFIPKQEEIKKLEKQVEDLFCSDCGKQSKFVYEGNSEGFNLYTCNNCNSMITGDSIKRYNKGLKEKD